jgi:HEPN domain-containing protein
MKKGTREWVRKAELDYRAAQRLSHGDDPFNDLCCFCCQQSAEKYLKALLEELGWHIPRTHILRDLLALLLPLYPSLRSLQRGLKFLTRFAVDIRYPGDSATSGGRPAMGRRSTQCLPHGPGHTPAAPGTSPVAVIHGNSLIVWPAGVRANIRPQ